MNLRPGIPSTVNDEWTLRESPSVPRSTHLVICLSSGTTNE